MNPRSDTPPTKCWGSVPLPYFNGERACDAEGTAGIGLCSEHYAEIVGLVDSR